MDSCTDDSLDQSETWDGQLYRRLTGPIRNLGWTAVQTTHWTNQKPGMDSCTDDSLDQSETWDGQLYRRLTGPIRNLGWTGMMALVTPPQGRQN
ncbi:hypothetical protein ACOMHN_000336 [Nucella lapillus]